MAGKVSAGLLVWRRGGGGVEVLLAHPGGPLWRGREAGAWSIPKGLIEPGEEPLAAALREFTEETGLPAPPGPFTPLEPVRQKAGKRVHAFATEADLDLAGFTPGLFTLEWPPRSGRTLQAPEVDRIAYMALPQALDGLIAGQRPLLDRLAERTWPSPGKDVRLPRERPR